MSKPALGAKKKSLLTLPVGNLYRFCRIWGVIFKVGEKKKDNRMEGRKKGGREAGLEGGRKGEACHENYNWK